MPSGPWDKYAAPTTDQAGPWAKYRTPEGPPAPPSQFSQDLDTVQKWADTNPTLPLGLNALPIGPAARFLVHAGQNAANAITQTPSFVYHAITAPPETPSEAALPANMRITSRLLGVPQAVEAGQAYASGQVTPKGALSVLPEALGTGVGQVAGGATYGKVGEVTKAIPGELNRVVPSRIRSGKGMGMLEQAYEAHPVTANKFLAETTKLQNELGTVGKQLPGPLAHLRDRIGLEGGNADLGIPPDPFAFQEARTALQQLNNEINFRSPSPADKIYMRAAGALADDIMQSTGEGSPVAPKGFKSDYMRMIDETRRSNKAIRFAANLGPYAGAFAGYELGHALGAPIGAEFATGYLGRAIGKPIAGWMARSIMDREGGPPNISAPPPPPMSAAPPPVPPPVTTPPVPPPPPAPVGAASTMTPSGRSLTPAEIAVQTQPGARGVSPTVGNWQYPGAEEPVDFGTKVRGKEPSRNAKVLGQAEALSGKPPEGVPERRLVDRAGQQAEDRLFAQARKVLGEDATSKQVADKVEELRKAQKRPSVPPPPPPKPIARNLPPEAYTRFLLEAKNGEISPSELERRMAKYGAGYVIRPLRQG